MRDAEYGLFILDRDRLVDADDDRRRFRRRADLIRSFWEGHFVRMSLTERAVVENDRPDADADIERGVISNMMRLPLLGSDAFRSKGFRSGTTMRTEDPFRRGGSTKRRALRSSSGEGETALEEGAMVGGGESTSSGIGEDMMWIFL